MNHATWRVPGIRTEMPAADGADSPWEQLTESLQLHILGMLRTDPAADQATWQVLLCTNSLLRRLASAFIPCSKIKFQLNQAFRPSSQTTNLVQGEAALAQYGLQQLACFPRLASLQSLHLSNVTRPIFHGHAVRLLQTAPSARVQFLKEVVLENFTLFLLDLDMLAACCPSLRRLRLCNAVLYGDLQQPLSHLQQLELLGLLGVEVRAEAMAQSLATLGGLRCLEWSPPTALLSRLNTLLAETLYAAADVPALHALRLFPPASSSSSSGGGGGGGLASRQHAAAAAAAHWFRAEPAPAPALLLTLPALQPLACFTLLQELDVGSACLDWPTVCLAAQLPSLHTLRAAALQLPASCQGQLRSARWRLLDLHSLSFPSDPLVLASTGSVAAVRVQRLSWSVSCCCGCRGGSQASPWEEAYGGSAAAAAAAAAEDGKLAALWLGQRLQPLNFTERGTGMAAGAQPQHVSLDIYARCGAGTAAAALPCFSPSRGGPFCDPSPLFAAVKDGLGSHIQALGLQHCRLDAGAAQQLLRSLPRVQHVSLVDGDISGAAADVLLQHLSDSRRLYCHNMQCSTASG